MEVAHKIKKLRELKNLTQEYMADELGITQGAYSKIENGETDLSLSKLDKIAEILGVSAKEIVNFDEQMVFNVMHNQTGNGLVINQNPLPDEMKRLYEEQIQLLKDENAYLKKTLENILSK